MRISLQPSHVHGQVSAPPSKSYAHRMLIGAGLSDGMSVVRGVSESQDMLATLDCLQALGATYRREGDTVTVWGRGCGRTADASGLSGPGEIPCLPCRESGSTLRFFIPLAVACLGRATLSGSPRLMERGVGVYETLFAEKGISLVRGGTDTLRVAGQLLPGTYTMRGDVSSQFITGLLYTLPLLHGGDSVLQVIPPVESRLYLDITVDVLRRFGVHVTQASTVDGGLTFYVKGDQIYQPADLTVEGDWSNGAFLHALNYLGGEVQVTHLDPDSLQGDKVCVDAFARLTHPGAQIDLSDCPDLGPVLFAVAAALGQGCVFTGTRRLRIKESDRVAAMSQELAKLGARMEVEENRVLMHPGPLHAPQACLCGHNDHRVVMALAVLATRYGGTIQDAQAVNKSYPGFFEVLAGLGTEVHDDI